MVELTLKSTVFRREREASWRELDRLVVRAEKKGLRALSAHETLRLQSLYRATLSSLSVARSISLDRSVLTYLEALSTRAYFCVYGPRARFFPSLLKFFAHGFPAAVRTLWQPIILAALIMFAGAATGFFLTGAEPDWFYAFVSEGMASGRDPGADTERLREVIFSTENNATDYLHVFASFLFTHNAKIGLLAVALGFALGVPTALLLFSNGLSIGAFSALHVGRALGLDFHGWLFIHGTTELLAVILCGGAGLAVGSAMIFPERKTRLEALTQRGRMAGIVAMGAVVMFFAAGLLEGFARQLINDTADRYVIGGGALLIWLTYFLLAGKKN